MPYVSQTDSQKNCKTLQPPVPATSSANKQTLIIINPNPNQQKNPSNKQKALTFATSRGLTSIAESTAAPAADNARSPNPMAVSAGDDEEEDGDESERDTLASKSTLDATFINAGRDCLDEPPQTIGK